MTEEQSRIERRKAKKEEKVERTKRKRERRPRIRLIPMWLRFLIAIVLIGGSLLLGIIVGYGVIGDGDPAEALKPHVWYHIIDMIRGN